METRNKAQQMNFMICEKCLNGFKMAADYSKHNGTNMIDRKCEQKSIQVNTIGNKSELL